MTKFIMAGGLFLIALTAAPLRSSAESFSQREIEAQLNAGIRDNSNIKIVSIKNAKFMQQQTELIRKLNQLGFEFNKDGVCGSKKTKCSPHRLRTVAVGDKSIFISVEGIETPADKPALHIKMGGGLTINLESDSLHDFMEKTGNAELIEKLVAALENPELIAAIAAQFGFIEAR